MASLAVTRKGFGEWRRVERHPKRRWTVVLELPDDIGWLALVFAMLRAVRS
jgi:hypothetical protein